MGMFVWIVFLIVFIVLYTILNKKVDTLNNKITDLEAELQKITAQVLVDETASTDLKNRPIASGFQDANQKGSTDENNETLPLESTVTLKQGYQEVSSSAENFTVDQDQPQIDGTDTSFNVQSLDQTVAASPSSHTILSEPDEQSTAIVTSVLHSLKNWFFGGNLVVRVGAIVLLMGVVLLLRLLSDYIETPITVKLAVIGIIGLAIAGLGLKLVKKRFTYGITLQGAGLAIAYLAAFFAYQVYEVLPSLPSFVLLGALSIVTVLLAVRQNAFPLALLALSGAFLAPILTGNNTGSLTILFGYYLLLNVAIAIIAHYRTWKVLNLLAATVTFGFAYYLGLIDSVNGEEGLNTQRWPLVIIVVLHWLLYVFVVIRYTQQLLQYNEQIRQQHYSSYINNSADLINDSGNDGEPSASDKKPFSRLRSYKSSNTAFIIPIDISLMFGVPLLAFGLLSTLLSDINNALTIASALMSATYLALGALFLIKDTRAPASDAIDSETVSQDFTRKGHYTPLIEGMLALGFGFFALMITLAFDAQWTACGWSIQGLALVWFGRHSLRGWTSLLGLILQMLAIASLLSFFSYYNAPSMSTLSLIISATCLMASLFILRFENSPIQPSRLITQQEQQLLASVNTDSLIFKLLWSKSAFVSLFCFIGMLWGLIVTSIVVANHFYTVFKTPVELLACILLLNVILYYVIDRYQKWNDVSILNHGLVVIFYLSLLSITYVNYEFYNNVTSLNWPIFSFLTLGWLIVGQLWIKRWYETKQLNILDSVVWLGTGIILIAQMAYYLLPNSNGVMTVLVTSVCLIGLTYLTIRNTHLIPLWFNWQKALLGCAYLFVPLCIGWVVLSNWALEGTVWGFPYIPLLNLYDISLLSVLAYLLITHYLGRKYGDPANNAILKHNMLLKVVGLLGFWIISSLLIRTLHAYIGTPLWYDGAWFSDQVQTALTIVWTLTALVATIVASRSHKRFWWFMGVGLLGIVVLKLVVVDLSQTDAIWRVVSFLGAGSLILLIGYLAPLPPELEETVEG